MSEASKNLSGYIFQPLIDLVTNHIYQLENPYREYDFSEISRKIAKYKQDLLYLMNESLAFLGYLDDPQAYLDNLKLLGNNIILSDHSEYEVDFWLQQLMIQEVKHYIEAHESNNLDLI